jgi:hypothetical protein
MKNGDMKQSERGPSAFEDWTLDVFDYCALAARLEADELLFANVSL